MKLICLYKQSYRTQQLTRESPIKLIDEDVDDTSRNI